VPASHAQCLSHPHSNRQNTTSSVGYATAKASEVLRQFEVGLDGVEAICQGQFRTGDRSYWKETTRDQQLESWQRTMILPRIRVMALNGMGFKTDMGNDHGFLAA
jgi:hypothetical protein